ncbi:MAG: hypothetical protein ABFD81_12250 [Syntrophaceae bacterium]
MGNCTLWIAGEIAKDLGLTGHEFPSQILEVKQLLYEVLKDGQPRDIIMLPFFRNYTEVVGHIRDRGIVGPIIIYTQGETLFMNISDMASQGVLFMDASRFGKPMMVGFLTFLRLSQEAIKPETEPEQPPQKVPSRATGDMEEIKEMLRQIMRRRTRLLVTCQFREDLPTLSVTCEVIQMVGEVETKLVLDKFNPQEFVGLYRTMAKGKPLVAYVSTDEESLGFELRVVHTVMDKITVLLPATMFDNKRRFFRVEPDVKDPVTMHILPENSATKAFMVRDVSEGGIGLNAPFAGLNLNAIYPIALTLPGGKLILGSANTVFKEVIRADLFNYGMILILNETDIVSVRQYVYKRQAGILAAIRNQDL